MGTHESGWLFQAGGGTNGGTTCIMAANAACTRPMPVDKACVDNAMGATSPADAGPRACPLRSNNRLPISKPKMEPTLPEQVPV